MTFDDDFMHLEFDGGVKRLFCKPNNIDWPPPLLIEVFGFTMKRVSMSALTDEQRAGMTHVCRGARYIVEE